jgi:hypothetical protein
MNKSKSLLEEIEAIPNHKIMSSSEGKAFANKGEVCSQFVVA